MVSVLRKRCASGFARPRSTLEVGPGQTSEESEVLRELRRENAELKRANAILAAASVCFAAEIDRPAQ